MKETLNRLSRELNIPVEELIRIYKAYWRFIKSTIEVLPLKENLSKEAFDKLKTNFNISNLGKLSCTYPRYKIIKDLNRRREDAKYKES
jgi:hypothetical protein